MSDTLFLKNVILKDWNLDPSKLETGLEITHRKEENNENYCTLVGTKPQINRYLQDSNILSDRLRTLNNLPKFRIINSVKIRIQ